MPREIKARTCPGPGWVRVRKRCEHGMKGPDRCRRGGVIRWNVLVPGIGGRRRRRLLKGAGVLVCRQCAAYLSSQVPVLALCLAAGDGAQLARQLWGGPGGL